MIPGVPSSVAQVVEAWNVPSPQAPDAVTAVHNETSTGVASPVGDIVAAVRQVSPDTLVLDASPRLRTSLRWTNGDRCHAYFRAEGAGRAARPGLRRRQ
ncbi:MAG: hypothetical protein R2856_04485 [Caldilineaceae bacterium]